MDCMLSGFVALCGHVRLPAVSHLGARGNINNHAHLGRARDAKKPPPRMGTARRLAEAYTARIVAPRLYVGRRGNRWAGHDMEHAACATAPANTRESLRPRRRASRHRGFAACIIKQRRWRFGTFLARDGAIWAKTTQRTDQTRDSLQSKKPPTAAAVRGNHQLALRCWRSCLWERSIPRNTVSRCRHRSQRTSTVRCLPSVHSVSQRTVMRCLQLGH